MRLQLNEGACTCGSHAPRPGPGSLHSPISQPSAEALGMM